MADTFSAFANQNHLDLTTLSPLGIDQHPRALRRIVQSGFVDRPHLLHPRFVLAF